MNSDTLDLISKINWANYDKFVKYRKRNMTAAEFRKYLSFHELAPDKKHCWFCGKELPSRKQFYCSNDCNLNFCALCSWAVTKIVIKKKYNSICQHCGKKIENGHTHHKIPISQGGPVFNPKNLIYLCEQCHRKVHTTIGLDNLVYFFFQIDEMIKQRTIDDFV